MPNNLSEHDFVITGSSGYIGSHLLKALHCSKKQSFVLSREGLITLEFVDENKVIRWKHNKTLSDAIFRIRNPIVINLAGHFLANHKLEDIDRLVDGNFKFTLKVLDLFRDTNAIFINIGSLWEFNDFGDNKPRNLYSCLKSLNSQLFEWYAEKYRISGINLKLNDTYGGIDNRNKLLPYFKHCFKKGVDAIIKSPNQEMNLTHIDDVIRAVFQACSYAKSSCPGQVKSFCVLSSETKTILDIAKLIGQQTNGEFSYITEPNEQEPGPHKINWDAFQILPNWKSSVPLVRGLKCYFEGSE